MSIQNNKLMNLADGKVLYDDLRRRIPEIDDTAGTGAITKVVSADKHATDHSALLNAINVLKPAATASDVGKFLKVKTVADGVPTSFEYGEGGSGGNVIDDTAGAGVTNKTWSADKLTTMLGDIETLLAAI